MVDGGYLEAGYGAGGTQTQVNRLMALPQSGPVIVSQVLYSPQLSVRISAILELSAPAASGA